MIIGLYAGTFDPITEGHRNIILRAARLCNRLVVGVAENPGKSPLFSVDERLDMVRYCLADNRLLHVDAEAYSGLLVDLAASVKATVLFRGMRPAGDFDHEFQLMSINQKLAPGLEMSFLMADPAYQAISSSVVKEVAKHKKDVGQFVDWYIAEKLKEKYHGS